MALPMRVKLVAGNWKMHGGRAANEALLDALLTGVDAGSKAQMAVIPPFPFLESCGRKLRGSPIRLGAQDVSEHVSGAFTGEVSAAMLVEMGCSLVLVGHSERRALHGETSEAVARKAAAASAGGLVPVICVGETLADREAGRTEAVVGAQLDAVLDGPGVELLRRAVVAYEPVWAIGTGRTASPEQAQEVHEFIRGRIAKRDAGCAAGLSLLYGGSVKGSNAAALFAMPDVDGGLVGGASLMAQEFLGIHRAAAATVR